MSKKIAVFISHKNAARSNAVAAAIEQRLLRENYEVFFDKTYLQGGHNWKEQILNFLIRSDVLIVLLEEATAESDWVQREVDMARGAHIQILPILIESSSAINRLDLAHNQYFTWDEARIDDVVKLVNRLSTETYDSQKSWIKSWQQRHDIQLDPRAIADAVTLTHPDIAGCTFYIAQGNAIENDEFHILVNTENNFMQMARAYETNTLSCAIRHSGAYLIGGLMREDTIQEQVFDQIKYSREHAGLPLPIGEVIVTTTGHKNSELAQRKFRYIFHAASVEIQRDDRTIVPLKVTGIASVIENCLKRSMRIEEEQGAILWQPSGELETAKPDHKPLTSILFPVFGAGQGGGQFQSAIEPILQAFKSRIPKYLNKENMNLRHFGLCVYDPSKIETVISAFQNHGFRVKARKE